jgi:hypothetical protein
MENIMSSIRGMVSDAEWQTRHFGTKRFDHD